MNITIETVIKVIGTVTVAMGLVYLVKPEFLRGIMRFFSEGRRMYFAALVRFALAVTFFMGARKCGITWVILLFGALFLLSGILIFLLGVERSRAIINWYRQQPKFVFRMLALVVLGAGLIIVYAS